MDRPELEAIGADLVHRLGGRWSDGGGLCRCPVHADRLPSLSIRIGRSNLLFHCFAGCQTQAILRWIRASRPCALARAPGGAGPVLPDGREIWLRDRAVALWRDARPIGDSMAQLYLQSRAIECLPGALRFHPFTPLGRGRAAARRPAMLARVSDGHGILAVQRTFLDDGGKALATDLAQPRRLLGRPRHGAVRLFAAASILGLAEGIETALSAAALLDLPVWATLGAERFSRITFPETVSRLILLPDNDPTGRCKADAARAHYRELGLEVSILLPWGGHNDWNDVLRLPDRAARGRG